MLLSLLKSPIVSPSLIPGFLILSAISELLFVMPNLSTNALILLLTGLNLNLSEIVTIISSLMPKSNISPNWSLHHLTIFGVSGKLSIYFETANLLHLYLPHLQPLLTYFPKIGSRDPEGVVNIATILCPTRCGLVLMSAPEYEVDRTTGY